MAFFAFLEAQLKNHKFKSNTEKKVKHHANGFCKKKKRRKKPSSNNFQEHKSTKNIFKN
jgi:hypothetical protein